MPEDDEDEQPEPAQDGCLCHGHDCPAPVEQLAHELPTQAVELEGVLGEQDEQRRDPRAVDRQRADPSHPEQYAGRKGQLRVLEDGWGCPVQPQPQQS
ncbi:hypothetical protein BH24CHL9_BH24CHL9_14970 [soil metagenome]